MHINKTGLSAAAPSGHRKTNNSIQKTNVSVHQDTFESEFNKKKKKIINNLKNFELIDKKLLKQLGECKNENEYNLVLGDIIRVAFHNLDSPSTEYESTLWLISQKLRKTTLAGEQFFRKNFDKKNKELVQIFKCLSEKDTNPEVVKINKLLTQKYGIKNVFLDNDAECANLYLEAVKLLKEKNFPIPDNIITSRYFPAAGVSFKINGQSYILTKTQKADETWWECSTDSPLHAFIHESVHCSQPELLAFNIKKIPAKFKNTVENLSIYAQGNNISEIHAELVAKKLICELSREEKELLNYIET